MKKYTLIALSIISIGILSSFVFLWLFGRREKTDKDILQQEISIEKKSFNKSNIIDENKKTKDIPQNNSQQNIPIKIKPIETQIPNFIQNKAPFISQAPFGVWDELHEEACEEASIIIANGFLKNIPEISKEKANKEILELVDWQIEKYGQHRDLNTEEIQNMAMKLYGDELEISEKVSEESFKKIIASGDIIIIPVAGKELKNPFFTLPGPLYHVLVVIGYDEATQEFITHDPGTRRGEGFRYSYQTLLESVHDFPGKKEKILEGTPRVLIVEKS